MDGYLLHFMTVIIFNIKGWKAGFSLVFYLALIALTDFAMFALCVKINLYYIIMNICVCFYTFVIYLVGIKTGQDKQSANLLLFVFLCNNVLIMGLNLVAIFGFEMIYGYLIIVFDLFMKKVLFALQV